MIILGSPDVTNFDIHALYDLSGPTPVVVITNKSVGNNLAGCKVIFELFSSSGIPYHMGLWTAPDAVGNFASWTSPPMLQVQNHIEWSGSDFKLKAYLMDSAGNVFALPEISTTICKPVGNSGKDNFASGSLDVRVLCQQARIYVEDVTNYSYKGIPGALVTKVLKLFYPADQTGTTPAPFIINQFNATLIPIWYSSEGYQLLQETIMQYNFGASSVKVKYKYKKFFPVLCNIDLCPLVCEVNRITHQLLQEGCSSEEREKLLLVTSKMNVALIAKLQPTCGIDLAKLVEEIKDIMGIDCDCNVAGSGIPQITSNQMAGYSPNNNYATPGGLIVNIT